MSRKGDCWDNAPMEGLGKFDLQGSGKLAALLGVSERAAAASQCEVLVGAGTRTRRSSTVIAMAIRA